MHARRWTLWAIVLFAVFGISSGLPQVLHWGQLAIRPAGSFLEQSPSVSNSFGTPDFLSSDLFGGAGIADMRCGPSSAQIYLTTDAQWYISGVPALNTSASGPKAYFPALVDTTATVADENSGNWRILDLQFMPIAYQPDPSLYEVQAFLERKMTANQYAFSSLAALGSEPATAFTFSLPGTPSAFSCVRVICIFLSSNEPYVYGNFTGNHLLRGTAAPTSLETVPTPVSVSSAWHASCSTVFINALSQVYLGTRHVVGYIDSSIKAFSIWGFNTVGQLADSNPATTCKTLIATSAGFPQLTGTGATVTKISVGFFHTVVLFSNGDIHSWGDNSRGQLGYVIANEEFSWSPKRVTTSAGSIFNSVGTYGMSTFATDTEGSVWAWGSNAAYYNPMTTIPYNPALAMPDGAPGVLGFGTSRPALSFLRTPTLVPWQRVPKTGAVMMKVIPAVATSTQGKFGDSAVNVIFDLATRPPTEPLFKPNEPYPNPPMIGDAAVVTWGSFTFPGISDYTDVANVPRPKIMTFPDPIKASDVKDIYTTTIGIQVLMSDKSFYQFGNMVRLPAVTSNKLALFIRSPFNSLNNTEGIKAGNVTLMARTSLDSIYYDADNTTRMISCGPNNAMSAGPELPQNIGGSPITAMYGGSDHFILYYAGSRKVQICPATCTIKTSPLPLELARANTGAICSAQGPGGANLEIFKVAAGDDVTVLWGCDHVFANCELHSYGYFATGVETYSAQPGTPNVVNVTGIAAFSSATPSLVKSIEIGYRFVLVQLEDNSVIGWGEIPGIGLAPSVELKYATLLIPPNKFSEPITQISAVHRSVFILSGGKIFGWGDSPSPSPLRAMPTLIPKAKIPLSEMRELIELQTIDGRRYNYTKLMASSALSNSLWGIPFAAVGTVLGPFSPLSPSITRSYNSQDEDKRREKSENLNFASAQEGDLTMVAWGNNVADVTGYAPSRGSRIALLASDDPHPYLQVPTPMFSADVPRNGSSPFPFNASTATLSFSNDLGFALDSDTDTVYYWGPSVFSTSGPPELASKRMDGPSNGMVPIMRGVTTMSAYGDGLVFWDEKRSILSCLPISDQTNCEGTLDAATGATVLLEVTFQAARNAAVDLACSTTNWCAVTMPGSEAVIFPGLPFKADLAQRITSLSNAINVWIAGNPLLTDSPFFHWNYTTGPAEPSQFGFSTPALPSKVFSVGLTSQYVSKIVSGTSHLLALLKNETFGPSIVGWGFSLHGELGFKSYSAVETAIGVHYAFFKDLAINSNSIIHDIAASGFASIALMENGDLYSWGANGRPLSSFDLSPRPPETIGNNLYFRSSHTATTPYLVTSRSSLVKLFSGPSSMEGVNRAAFRAFGIASSTPISPSSPNFTPSPRAPGLGGGAQTCPPPKPSAGAVCELVEGNPVWVIPSSVNTTTSTAIIITSNTVIKGNLSVLDSGSLVFQLPSSGQVPLLIVNGCVYLSKPITLTLTTQQLEQLAKKSKELTLIDAECIVTRSGTTIGSALTVSTPKTCKKITLETKTRKHGTRTTLTTLISLNSSKCNRWWIILVSVLGAVAIITVLLIIVFIKSPCLHMKFQPYRGTNMG